MSNAAAAPPPFPTLHTPRLVLREITTDDAPALLAIHGDAETMRWFGTDPPPDLAAAKQLVQLFAGWRLQANPGTRWGLQRADDPRLLGSVGLFAWNRAWRKCSLGYELARDAQGQGLMHEALCAVLDWGFAQMQLHRVEAQVHPDNTASLRLVQRLGFQQEGRLREVGHWAGQAHDLLQWGLLQREWRATGTPQASAVVR
jgi:ribosomal-protein-alanine N-acetyltransferase